MSIWKCTVWTCGKVSLPFGDWLESKIVRKLIDESLPMQREMPAEFMLAVHLKMYSNYLRNVEFLPKEIVRLKYTLPIGKRVKAKSRGHGRL